MRGAAFVAAAVALCVAVQAGCDAGFRRSALGASLGDREFWQLSTALSEPPGPFDNSENLVSNETRYADLSRMLRQRKGVYIGVGPEQNFSYIAALRPEMAFIVDIRRENRNLHLLYKGLFELSANRAEFVSHLFSRPLSSDTRAGASAEDLFRRLELTGASHALFLDTARRVKERLVEAHGFALTSRDLDWIEYVLRAFYSDGPDIHYSRSRPDERRRPSYRLLMTGKDLVGRSRSYLAADEGFAFVKDLQARNLIVPVVGDFAGPHAIRRTADYVRRHEAEVGAFYASNVEVYLNSAQTRAFCENLATTSARVPGVVHHQQGTAAARREAAGLRCG